MFISLVIFHVFVSAALVMVVLLQTSKGEALTGSALGGGGGGSFGPRSGGTFLSKVTTVLAVVFILNCIGLALISAGQRKASTATGVDPNARSIVSEQMKKEVEKQQAAAAAAPPVQQDTSGAFLMDTVSKAPGGAQGGK